MGHGYPGTFLIVFLTHPGVIIPTTSSVVEKASAFLPPNLANAISSEGVPPLLTGLWQVMWTWILSFPGNKNTAVAWTMYILYLMFLFVYMYFILRIRIMKGI